MSRVETTLFEGLVDILVIPNFSNFWSFFGDTIISCVLVISFCSGEESQNEPGSVKKTKVSYRMK